MAFDAGARVLWRSGSTILLAGALALGLCGFRRAQPAASAGAECAAPQTQAAVTDILYKKADQALTRMAGGQPDPSHAILKGMRGEPLITFDAIVLDSVDRSTGRVDCTAEVRATPAAADLSGARLKGIQHFLEAAGSYRLIPAEGFPDRPATSPVAYSLQPTVNDRRRFVYQADDQPPDLPVGAIAPEEGTVAGALALIALGRAEAAGGAP